MEWDAERRARWLYNNRYQIEQSAYERGIQDAKVQQYIREYEQKNVSRDVNYVDRDFAENPSLMYTEDYVSAARSDGENKVLWYAVATMVSVAAVVGLYFLFFKVRFGQGA